MTATTDFRDARRRQAFTHKHPLVWKDYNHVGTYTRTVRGEGAFPNQEVVGGIVTAAAPNFGATTRLVVDYAFVEGRRQYFRIVKVPSTPPSGFEGCHEGQVFHGNGQDRAELVYLPWHESVITSMLLPPAATFFVTGPLSGCHVYVARDAAGRTQVCHANSNVMKTLHNRPDLSVAYMDRLYALAQRPGFALVARLQKSDYLPSLQLAERNTEDGWGKVSTEITTGLLDAYVLRKSNATDSRGARGNVQLASTQAFVFGERLPGQAWQFFYHVSGRASYTRSWRTNVNDKWKSVIDVAPVPAANNDALVVGSLSDLGLGGVRSEITRRAAPPR